MLQVIVKRKAIQIAVGIIKEASDAIKKMPCVCGISLSAHAAVDLALSLQFVRHRHGGVHA